MKCENGPKPPFGPYKVPRANPDPAPWLQPKQIVFPEIPAPEAVSPEDALGVGGIIILILSSPFWAFG
tara:strand:- start:837 stop:1040 length:204 start_codon:yes stop_codon:yes gene_type:complete